MLCASVANFERLTARSFCIGINHPFHHKKGRAMHLRTQAAPPPLGHDDLHAAHARRAAADAALEADDTDAAVPVVFASQRDVPRLLADREGLARRLAECHALLAELARSSRPVCGGFAARAADLLDAHGAARRAA
jgi:hypothetical protein